MRTRTTDRGFYTTGALGKSRRITPEGFLLCEGVAIGRTGVQVYSAKEIALEPNAAGEIRVERLPEEVFRPETIASFEGKSITVNHPDEFVTPENWKQLSVGLVQNVRQGDGLESDLLLADLLITSADAIAYANREFPELSPGYEADYEQVVPGAAIQRNIIGNHVAFVKRGRAGPRCAIRDEETAVKKGNFLERLARLLAAVKSKDSAAVTAELDDIEADPTPQDEAIRQVNDRVVVIETGLAEIKALLTKDEGQRQAAAPAALELNADALREIVARAEILSPGFSMPTMDALAAGDAAQQLMRSVLEKANSTTEGAEAIKPFLMGREIKVLTGDTLLGVFTGAAELTRERNNRRTARAPARDSGSKPLSIADINKRNSEFWAGQK